MDCDFSSCYSWAIISFSSFLLRSMYRQKRIYSTSGKSMDSKRGSTGCSLFAIHRFTCFRCRMSGMRGAFNKKLLINFCSKTIRELSSFQLLWIGKAIVGRAYTGWFEILFTPSLYLTTIDLFSDSALSTEWKFIKRRRNGWILTS